jgi:hypothetical protein
VDSPKVEVIAIDVRPSLIATSLVINKSSDLRVVVD